MLTYDEELSYFDATRDQIIENYLSNPKSHRIAGYGLNDFAAIVKFLEHRLHIKAGDVLNLEPHSLEHRSSLVLTCYDRTNVYANNFDFNARHQRMRFLNKQTINVSVVLAHAVDAVNKFESRDTVESKVVINTRHITDVIAWCVTPKMKSRGEWFDQKTLGSIAFNAYRHESAVAMYFDILSTAKAKVGFAVDTVLFMPNVGVVSASLFSIFKGFELVR